MKKKIKTNVIEHFIKENQLSKTRFCKLCDISLSTFRKIMAQDYRFRLKAIFKIANAMNIPVGNLFY
jgi:predicted transcriptional regulator